MAQLLFRQKTTLHVLGVEPQDYTTWNIGLSPAVQAVFPTYLEQARKEIRDWLAASSADAAQGADGPAA